MGLFFNCSEARNNNKFDSNMEDDLSWIQKYLTDACKTSSSQSEESPFEEVKFTGRWSFSQWRLYVLFSLMEFLKDIKRFGYVRSYKGDRRPYSSTDRRFAQFVKEKVLNGNMSQDEIKTLIKRTKSKFNTLKRSYIHKSKKKESKITGVPDFEELIVLEAQKLIEQGENIGLKKQLDQYLSTKNSIEAQKIPMSRDSQTLRRYQVVSTIKTRLKSLK